MKTRVFMLLMLGGAFLPTMGQNNSSIALETFEVGTLKNIQVVGEEAIVFTDSLFAHFNKKPTQYLTKFKKVVIEGVKEPVTFQVHQGYFGKVAKAANDTSEFGESAYFRTFTKKQDRKQSLKKENEQDAVTIYLKQGKNYGVKSKAELELIKKYLISIYS